jgi:hypothetical protein
LEGKKPWANDDYLLDESIITIRQEGLQGDALLEDLGQDAIPFDDSNPLNLLDQIEPDMADFETKCEQEV